MAEALRVLVEFDTAQDPIAGTLTAGRYHVTFTGWLSLITGLQDAIGAGRRGSPGRVPRETELTAEPNPREAGSTPTVR